MFAIVWLGSNICCSVCFHWKKSCRYLQLPTITNINLWHKKGEAGIEAGKFYRDRKLSLRLSHSPSLSHISHKFGSLSQCLLLISFLLILTLAAVTAMRRHPLQWRWQWQATRVTSAPSWDSLWSSWPIRHLTGSVIYVSWWSPLVRRLECSAKSSQKGSKC